MNDLRTRITAAQVELAAKELFDKSAKTVYVICGKHMYSPSKMGIEGHALSAPTHLDCKECWQAYYLVYFAKLPPHIRAERLDQSESTAHHAVEDIQAGRWDFKLYRHPEIKIEHED